MGEGTDKGNIGTLLSDEIDLHRKCIKVYMLIWVNLCLMNPV